MTGTYENIRKLQNDKSSTFLYRAPKIHLQPLSINAIASSYENFLHVSSEKAMEFAKFTNGYAYAYQVLGHLLYEKEEKELTKELILDFDQYMAEYVYEKIFSESSSQEQKILLSFNTDETVKVEELREKTSLDSKTMSVCRDRLIGVLLSPKYGYLKFAFPRFNEYLREKE
jgi:hypothetical protein